MTHPLHQREEPPEGTVDYALRLVCELCAASAAFLVTPDGTMTTALGSTSDESHLEERTQALARICLSYPAAVGASSFCVPDPLGTAESAGNGLACVAVPLATPDATGHPAHLGLLGVVGSTEPPESLHHGLLDVARRLCRQLLVPTGKGDGPEEPVRPVLVDAAQVAPSRSLDDELYMTTSQGARRSTTRVYPASSMSVGSDLNLVLRAVVDSLDHGVVVCDAIGNVILANPEALDLQGIPPGSDITGRPFEEVVPLASATGSPLPPSRHPLGRAIAGSVTGEQRLSIDRGARGRMGVVVSARPLRLSTGESMVLLVLRDATAQIEREAWLARLSLHDPLTGLPNRSLLLDRLERSLALAKRDGGDVAVLFIDLDRFKHVNDLYGHRAGDLVLVAISRLLASCVRSTDTASRLGGDEFVVVAYAAPSDPGGLTAIKQRICSIFPAQVALDHGHIEVTASIGYAVADLHRHDAIALLGQADHDMYHHKARLAC
ncbi:MAG: diguanylate cyclase domain-containing protein [Acidimicrobiales bacterium]